MSEKGKDVNLKEALQNLLGQGVKQEEISAELDTLKQDNMIEDLQRSGLLSADQAAVAAARTLIALDPEALRAVLQRPPVIPTTSQAPPAGPTDTDPTEAAIKALMTADPKMPYHTAAMEASTGGKITRNA